MGLKSSHFDFMASLCFCSASIFERVSPCWELLFIIVLCGVMGHSWALDGYTNNEMLQSRIGQT